MHKEPLCTPSIFRSCLIDNAFPGSVTFFWHLSKSMQWQKTVVFQYPALSAFRRTFSAFVFLTPSQSHDLVHPSSIYFFNDLHAATFCFIKSSAQGFPIHIDVVIRMIHLSFIGTQPGGQVCLWAVIYLDWFLFLLLLYWNQSHQLAINWPEARCLLWTKG